MAQTTAALSFKDCLIEYSVDNGATYTDCSGFTSSVQVSGGDWEIAEEHTFEGDTPVMAIGKRHAFDVTVRTVYTEGAGELFAILLPIFESGDAILLRYTPKGTSTGIQFTTQPGYIVSHLYPQGAANDGKPVVLEVKLRTPGITHNILVDANGIAITDENGDLILDG